MKQVPIRLGPAALLLTVITICLTVMAILTISTAGADKTMADKFADSARVRCSLEKNGQLFLQEADRTLASGGKLTDLPDAKAAEDAPKGSVEKTIQEEDYHLTIRLEPAGKNDYTITGWTLDKDRQEPADLDVWQPGQ